MDGLRLRRITNAMTEAAEKKRLFHLWWHPHNFGVNREQNLAFLGKIIAHFRHLRETRDMRSLNMSELCACGENALAG
jgi:hypothetical protein